MKSLTKYPVAIFLSALLILLSIALGQAKHHEATVPVPEPSSAEQQSAALDTSLPTDQYHKYILDESNLLSPQTKEEISQYNANFYEHYGSIVSVVVVPTTNESDIKQEAYQYAENQNLSENDALLLLGVQSSTAYLATGENFFPNWESSDIRAFLAGTLHPQYSSGETELGLLSFFSSLNTEFINANPSENSATSSMSFGWLGFFSIIPALFFLFLVILIFTIVDNARYSRYLTRFRETTAPPVFRPILFWHGPRSRWYRRRQHHHTPPPGFGNDHRGGFGGFRGAGFWGSGFGGFPGGGFDGGFGGDRGGGFDGGFGNDRGGGFDGDFGNDRGGGFDGGFGGDQR